MIVTIVLCIAYHGGTPLCAVGSVRRKEFPEWSEADCVDLVPAPMRVHLVECVKEPSGVAL